MNDKPSENGVLTLSLEFQEIPLKIKGADGVERDYVLREMDGKERDGFLNVISNRQRVSGSGKVIGVKNNDELMAELIHRSLYDDQGKRVPKKEIQSWPASVQNTLMLKAQKLSALDEESIQTAKNS